MKKEEKKTTCDPCSFCQHLCSGEAYIGDTAYGNTVTEYDCAKEADWDQDPGVPCPEFKQILASQSLFDQLANEAEYEMWKEMQNAQDEDAEECE